jgi:3-hydroxybutyryl-CoA dehydrogenase
MGHQIALQCAVHGYDVHVYDISEKALDKAKENIRKVLEKRVGNKEISKDSMQKTLSKITFDTSLERAAKDADFVVEAVFEDSEVKRKVFSQLDRFCPPHAVLGSNTSSIKSSLFADATKRPEKIVDMNFSNPVWEHKMVEIMGNPKTTKETMEIAKYFVQSIDLTPIITNKERTGYAFNKVWRAIKKEALATVDQGYASFEDIDRAFIIALGTKIGPFMLMDIIGLDVVKAIEEQYYRESKDPTDRPPKLLEEKIRKGELGVKTGRGFYTYPNPSFEKPDWLKGKT